MVVRSVLNGPIDPLFSFLSNPASPWLLAPSQLSFVLLYFNRQVTHAVYINSPARVCSLPIRCRSRIESREPSRSFVDSQLQGFRRAWWPERHFPEDSEALIMEDWGSRAARPIACFFLHDFEQSSIATPLRFPFDSEMLRFPGVTTEERHLPGLRRPPPNGNRSPLSFPLHSPLAIPHRSWLRCHPVPSVRFC